MKLRHKSTCYLKNKIVQRGSEGNRYASFSAEAVKLSATICSGSGKLVPTQAGFVQQYEKKLLCDAPFRITNEAGTETYWIQSGDGEHPMSAGDGICLYVEPTGGPDYRIVAIHPVGHLKILLERNT